MRSIIVEGMDGSGKDTLIRDLQALFPKHKLHERASDSLKGPVSNLGEWVARDAVRMGETGPWIYNRHPLISEPIYGKIRPGKPTVEPFNNSAWLNAYQRIVGRESVVVLCHPPYHVVKDTLRTQGADAHMPGVFENQVDLWVHYQSLVWPGRIIRYDYTRDNLFSLTGLLERTLGE
jgi:hypothetical protein